jgi:hypothetical protein|tara:strand:+ start:10983 stop:12461 length:1479 start_codon:yes stop_codon:yes gene_type:complete
MNKEFYKLFEGLTRAHGEYTLNGKLRADGKKEGRATTVRQDVTLEKWEAHLTGKKGLGIIPINDKSMCKFGAIDIDVYKDLDYESILLKVKSFKLPLYACKSKSGGVHLYIFLNEWTSALIIQTKLKEFAAMLGFGGSEIFPKQTEILADRGDIGQWINMPYFGDQRWCNGLSPLEFLKQIKKVNIEELDTIAEPTGDTFSDGPPCLQHLAGQGFPAGTRNNGLFNIAVYARKSSPDTWEAEVDKFNIECMDPPLPSSEVQAVIKSATRKDYHYTCSRAPIAPYCNAPVCKLRKFGIEGSNDMPTVHSLTKFDSNPPIWFLDIEGGGRLELETDDLQNQRRFQKKCMEKLNLMPSKISEPAWGKLINHLMENLTVIPAPADASPIGQLFEHIERFCNGRVQAKNKDELLLGKPWLEDNRHYFRITDLMAYLDRMHFRDYKVNQITAMLKSNNAEHHFFNCKGKGVNCWSLAAFEKHEGEFEVPVEGTNEVPF